MSRPTYEQLEDENAVLRKRLKEIVSPTIIARLRESLALTPQQAAVLACLFQHSPITNESLYAAVFQYRNGDGPEIGIINAVICRLRRNLRLSRVPGAVENQYATGYSISPAMRTWIADLLATNERGAAA